MLYVIISKVNLIILKNKMYLKGVWKIKKGVKRPTYCIFDYLLMT